MGVMAFDTRLVALAITGIAVFAACGGDGGGPAGPGPPDPPEPPAPNELPTARITSSVDAGPAPLAVTFDARSSTDPDGTIASYSWTFGDGGSASGAEVSHTFNQAGLFQVELTVVDDRGGADSTKDSVFVSSPPGPGNPPDPGNPGAPSGLSASWSPKGGGRVELSWTPGGGAEVDVYRSGAEIATTSDNGRYNDRDGTTSDDYQVCVAGAPQGDPDQCSSVVNVN